MSSWFVITDACAASKASPQWGPFISSYRIYWDSREKAPIFEGAQMCHRTGINRAELLAIAYGLQALALGMESDEYVIARVNVWTDSETAFKLATHQWQGRALAALVSEVDQLCGRISEAGAGPVWFYKGTERDVKAADTLGRGFKNVCDDRHRRTWARKPR